MVSWDMPARNAIKCYVENGYYHIYNRGANKCQIFLDSADFSVFLDYVKQYLVPKDERLSLQSLNNLEVSSAQRQRIVRGLALQNFSQDIILMAYCLMPNHFHFFLKQKSLNAMNLFMKSLTLRYAMYFNRRYERSGPLFQGVYKAILMTDEAHYSHLSRYMHKQALADSVSNLDFPSSYPEYLGLRKTEWVHPDEILTFFSNSSPKLSYQAFVTEYNPIYDTGEAEIDC
jgi:putative transposase